MDTRLNLIDFTTSGASLIKALKADRNNVDGFYWAYKSEAGEDPYDKSPVSTNILADNKLPSFNMPACIGNSELNVFATNGCYLSECLSEDDQEPTFCEKECPSGYTNWGTICKKNIVSSPRDKETYSYGYRIPSNDVGLFRRRNMAVPAEAALPLQVTADF